MTEHLGNSTRHKNISLLLILLALLLKPIKAQNADSIDCFGSFNSAASIAANEVGDLFVIDSQDSKLFKLDTLGNILAETGGFGWETGLFDQPVDVSSAPLRVIVCDKNNHRLQFFDRNLASIGVLNNSQNDAAIELFRFPVSAIQNNQGDLFILDSENKQILRIDAMGSRASSFAGLSYGAFSLTEPRKIRKSANEQIAVLDKNRIIFFDNFGNGIYLLQSPPGLYDFDMEGDKIVACNASDVFLHSVDCRWESIYTLPAYNGTISGVCLQGNTIYILTPKRVLKVHLNKSLK